MARHAYYDVTATVHYGHWHHPDRPVETTRVVTLPRTLRTPQGEPLVEGASMIERDPVRASWPFH